MMPYVAMHALGPGESPCASVCVNVWWGIGAVCSVNIVDSVDAGSVVSDIGIGYRPRHFLGNRYL